MVAAALRPGQVDAVVCRGGRPDLAVAWLDLLVYQGQEASDTVKALVTRFDKLANQAMGPISKQAAGGTNASWQQS